MKTSVLTNKILEGTSLNEMFAGGIVKKRVIRGGKFVIKRTHRVHRHTPLSPERRRALKKAHKAAMRGEANRKRKRSLHRRLQMEGVVYDVYLTPCCGLELQCDEQGYFCPGCGESYDLVPADEYEFQDEESYEDTGFDDEAYDDEYGDEFSEPEAGIDPYTGVPYDQGEIYLEGEGCDCGDPDCDGSCEDDEAAAYK